MANPSGHIVLDEEAERAAEEHYTALEVELQAMRVHNKELTCGLQEYEEMVVAEWLQADQRVQAQMCKFANLMAELLAGRQGPEVQMDGTHISVKVEKLENYDCSKGRDVDTWLF